MNQAEPNIAGTLQEARRTLSPEYPLPGGDKRYVDLSETREQQIIPTK